MDFEQLEKSLYGNVDEDEELLAELLALEAEEKEKMTKKTQSNIKRPDSSVSRGSSGVFGLPTEAIKEALVDVETDGIVSDEDLDDPELLAEFSNLVDANADKSRKSSLPSEVSETSIPSVDSAMLQRLENLQENYENAVASADGDAPKIRRYQRSLEKIQELVKKVQSGKSINENEIPLAIPLPNKIEKNNLNSPSTFVPERPLVSSKSNTFVHESTPNAVSKKLESSTASTSEGLDEKQLQPFTSSSTLSNIPLSDTPDTLHDVTPGSSHILKADRIMKVLEERRRAYLKNAKLANDANDKSAAFGFFTIVKQFDQAIAMVKSGEVLECDENELPPLPASYRPVEINIPPQPKNLLEGLNQRLEKYKTLCEQSKRDNDNRKYRMNTRIVKRYEEAIRALALKQPYEFNELPCPPGYPPLPQLEKPPLKLNAPSDIATVNRTKVHAVKPSKVHPAGPSTTTTNRTALTTKVTQKSQLEFLLKRQLHFKQAAVAAKQKKDITLAKKYLVAAKGFDSLIASAQAGKRVDIRNLPVPPQIQRSAVAVKPVIKTQQIETDFEIVEDSREDIFATLEKDLIKQVKLCDENRLGFTKLGDVTRVGFFEGLLRETKVDLLYLRQLAKTNAAAPRFCYETRDFPSMEICADVSEDHLELSIIRVVDAKLPSGSHASLLCFAPYRRSQRSSHPNQVPRWKPSDGNIFVRYEFAFPYNAHQSGKTKVVAGTNSPEFNETVLLGINRKSKQLLRIVKRSCLKLEVYQKRGFLRSDRLLGVADCKLHLLENKAQIHEAVDLMEGRKAAGGKIEYKVRVKEPLGENKASIVQERWLVLLKTV